jgi:hypothetical protein
VFICNWCFEAIGYSRERERNLIIPEGGSNNLATRILGKHNYSNRISSKGVSAPQIAQN